MVIRTLLIAGFIVVLPMYFPESFSNVAAQDDPARALESYVMQEDPGYRWEVRRTGDVAGVSYSELLLVSQVWRGIPWRHQLYMIWPDTMAGDATNALLFIHGGRWSEELDELAFHPPLPGQAPLFAVIAQLLQTPVAVLQQVPFQPLFDGLTEDALISYTFERYLETGEQDWPLLLPMVKSAVRAMDAVQEHAIESRGMSIETFTVTGASKRGWTTWLAGAVDTRVRGIVPMVIDVLNMPRHLEHQITSWGAFSRQIADYTERGFHEALDTAAGKALLQIVDPYRYRDRLDTPKLVVIGTNDEYWPLDALNLYWDGLPEPKRILYLPNQGHRAEDYPRIIGSVAAFHRHVTSNDRLPAPDWRFEEDDDALRLRVRPDAETVSVSGWTALSHTRDFRQARWTRQDCSPGGQQRICEMARPDEGYAALFAEFVYPIDGEAFSLNLSTQVRIIGPHGFR